MPLSNTVLQRIRALGGTLGETSESPVELEGRPVPEPLRQLAAVRWPAGVTFRSEESDSPWVRSLELAGIAAFDWKGTGLVERDRPGLVAIGSAGGGNYMLAVSLDDSNPANPKVYKIDHDEPGQRRGRGTPLSKFLSTLRPDEEEAARRAEHGPHTGADAVTLSPDFAFAAHVVLEKRNPFAPADLARVRTLEVTYATSLDDLRHFPALENLGLRKCALPDLGGLTAAPALRNLFISECDVSDWSALSSLTTLRELHLPVCGLTHLGPLAPLTLERADVRGNALGVDTADDIARLPSDFFVPHPGIAELETNDALRERGIAAACLKWEDDHYLLVRRPSPTGSKGTGHYTDWRIVRLQSLREELSRGSDVAAWIDALPRAPRTIDWSFVWSSRCGEPMTPP